jgi:hypothetical protein
MRTLSNTSDTFITVETWSKETEATACKESRNACAGAPYYVALDGRVQCVTRRCAEELMKHRKICGCIPARDAGNGGINHATLKAAAHGQTVGVTFQLKNLGDKTWMIYCPEMRCEYPTKNPGREMMLLAAEFTTLVESDYAGLEQP